MIDVEEFVAINPDSSFRRCWQKVVRGRRQSEVVDRQRALSEFYRLLDEHVTSFHPDCPDEHGLEKTLCRFTGKDGLQQKTNVRGKRQMYVESAAKDDKHHRKDECLLGP